MRSIVPFVFGGVPARANPFWLLQRDMNRLFGDVFRELGDQSNGGDALIGAAPRIDVAESDQEITIKAELPGVPEDGVDIELVDDVLTIRGEKKVEEKKDKENYHVVERAYGSFARSIRLPIAVKPDQVKASFENGVLTIRLPKEASQRNVHRISVQRGEKSHAPDRAAAGDKPSAAGENSQSGSDSGQSAASA